jgi:hypothetical protein
MGPEVSGLVLLATAEFRLPAHALPQLDVSKSIFSLFRIDQSALTVADAMIRALQSGNFKVGAPRREGRWGVWFRCQMENYDAGVSLGLTDRWADSVNVHIAACQLPKPGQRDAGGSIDSRWHEVFNLIRSGIDERFGSQVGFVWREIQSTKAK